MASEQPPNGDGAPFPDRTLGLQTTDGDWDVDGPNVVQRKMITTWMADAYRPQPFMADYAGSVDDDS